MSATKITKGSLNFSKFTSKYEYTWEIENFSATSAVSSNDYIYSEEFTTGGEGCSCRWRLHLYPMGVNEEFRDVTLFLHSLNEFKVDVEFKLSILNHKNEIAKEHTWKYEFCSKYRSFGSFDFFKRSEIEDKASGILVDDKLRIMCEVTSSSGNSEFILRQPDFSNRLAALDHFEQLLDDEKFSDIKIIAGGKFLHAHKAVLSRSPVFAAMLEHDMKESNENEVNITDIDYEVLREMLRFVYGGKVRNIEKIAGQLFVAADKYGLADLKDKCEDFLLDHLTLNNAFEAFEIADLYSMKILRKRVKDFISANAKDIVQHSEFIVTVRELRGDLLSEIIQALVLREN